MEVLQKMGRRKLMNDNKFWLGIWALVTLVLIALTLSMFEHHAYVMEQAFKYGYEERTDIGTNSILWKKITPVQAPTSAIKAKH